MRKLLILCFGVLIGLPSLAQVDPDWSKFTEDWDYLKAKTAPASKVVKGYFRVVVEPVDTATWIYTITRQRKVWPVPQYDTTWTATDYNNNNAAIVYAPAGAWALGTGQTKFFNGDFHYGTGSVARTATLSVTSAQPVRISLYSERFAGHGDYTISVGSVSAGRNAGIAPVGSDKDRSWPSFRSQILPAGTYVVTVSASAQMVIDLIRVEKLTLTPRP